MGISMAEMNRRIAKARGNSPMGKIQNAMSKKMATAKPKPKAPPKPKQSRAKSVAGTKSRANNMFKGM
jgi:hypothetical protein